MKKRAGYQSSNHQEIVKLSKQLGGLCESSLGISSRAFKATVIRAIVKDIVARQTKTEMKRCLSTWKRICIDIINERSLKMGRGDQSSPS